MLFDYHCPDCRTTNDLHESDCRFSEFSAIDIEIGYHHIFRKLATGTTDKQDLLPESQSDTSSIGAAALESGGDPSDFAGTDVGAGGHQAFVESALAHLEQTNRIATVGDQSTYRLLPPDEYKEEVSEPQMEPIRTVYEKGSVPGCHDNAVFAMIAFYEMVGMSWEETREHVLQWLEETGTWERGGFAESGPEELVDQKQHVYESGYGWKDKAKAAKKVIDQEL